MRRKLFNLAAAVSLMLSMPATYLWWRSTWTTDWWQSTRVGPRAYFLVATLQKVHLARQSAAMIEPLPAGYTLTQQLGTLNVWSPAGQNYPLFVDPYDGYRSFAGVRHEALPLPHRAVRTHPFGPSGGGGLV